MTDMTENELARTWEPGQPRCMVEGCEEAPTATLLGKAGNTLGSVCAVHARTLGSLEPRVRIRDELEGWVFVQQVGELRATLHPPGSPISNAVHGIIR